MPRLSGRTSDLHASPVREMLSVAQRPGVISFAGGLPAPETFAGLDLPAPPSDLLQYGPSFALYSVLYAGAAALVSRTEDINQIIAPMTLISTAGYLVAVWSSTGILSPDSKVVIVMSYIPFFSPYLMLTRIGAGTATPFDIALSLAILVISVPAALWVASRFYAAGVLLYGQRPSVRLMLRVIRGG